jgi:putative glycosyltransferase (TIGR04348 family)
MRIVLVTPAPRGSRAGNRVTAMRWARLLRGLGCRVDVRQDYHGEPCDLLLALHARKSFGALSRFRELHPEKPLLVALTGTDLYRDLAHSPEARQALRWADRLIVLQEAAVAELADALRGKARVVYQSAVPTAARVSKSRRSFDVCVVGHLRPVKDPFLAAAAARLLPPASRLRIVHAGAALDREMQRLAEREASENPRYRWLGERPAWQVRRLLARCHAMVLSSRLEGGANVVSEACVAALPVLSTRISGSIGMLGENYPGYFEVGDSRGLAALLGRCETDSGFLADLGARCRALAPGFTSEHEQGAWRDLLSELTARA